jgi:hypothetical protein
MPGRFAHAFCPAHSPNSQAQELDALPGGLRALGLPQISLFATTELIVRVYMANKASHDLEIRTHLRKLGNALFSVLSNIVLGLT